MNPDNPNFRTDLENKRNKSYQAEIAQLKMRLLQFEGMTFSENQEIATLKSKLDKAVSALKFYADCDQWNHLNASTTYSVIGIDDLGKGDFQFTEDVDDNLVGGLKARQALKELGE